MSTYTRQCPTCNKSLTYSSYKNLWRANNNRVSCVDCTKSMPKKPKLEMYKRNCPECNVELIYSSLSTLKKAKDKKCQSCVQRPLSTGRRHTQATRNKIKKNHARPWLGKKKPMTPETRKKIRLATINFIQATKGKCSPRYNPIACELFNKINKMFALNGMHAENGGEYFIKELGYWLDYYEPTLNLVIEYYEDYHNRTSIIEKDKIRERQIIDKLGCKLIIFRKTDDEQTLYQTIKEVL
jgi:hypothetical protein